MDKSLTFEEVGKLIRNINPDCRFKVETYDYIDRFSNIESLMYNLDALVILYRTDPSYGHYTVLTKCDTPEYRKYLLEIWGKKTNLPSYCFFDSYGLMIDKELSYVPERLKIILGQEFPHLKSLLIKCPNVVEWDHHKLQGETSSTCGRYCALRAAEYYIPLEDWVRQLRVKGKTPDQVILDLTMESGGSMFGVRRSGGKRKKSKSKSRRKRIGDTGNIIQNVHVTIGGRQPRAVSEKPISVPDSRLDAVNIYSAPKLRTTAPKQLDRPSQGSVFSHQIQMVDHNANGVISSNLGLASAVSQLANSLTGVRAGNRQFDAQKAEEAKFMQQSTMVGGAGIAVQGVEQESGQNVPSNARQEALNNQMAVRQLMTLPESETRPDVAPTARAQITATEQEIAKDAEQTLTSQDAPILLQRTIMQPIQRNVTTTVDLIEPINRSRPTQAIVGRAQLELENPPSNLAAFPVIQTRIRVQRRSFIASLEQRKMPQEEIDRRLATFDRRRS